ncbi:repair protein PSO2 SNM1 [Coemansia erecta]|nr:repair protein PSO2 SNM1 [Coemansia erecta]
MPSITCPICWTQLDAMSTERAELHVNGCLDASVLAEKKRARRVKSAATKLRADDQGRSPPTAKHSLTSEEPSPVDIDDPILDASAEHAASGPVFRVQPGGPPRSAAARPLPPHKRMPFTSFTVDAFKYGVHDFCTGYFLTHFHSDHYGGLTRGFTGHVYCSRITAACVTRRIGVDPAYVHALPMDTRCNVHGVYVTLIDANHCPGAVVIVFEVPRGEGVVRIVHTGDFRATFGHVARVLRIAAVDVGDPVGPGDIACGTAVPCVSPAIDYVYLDTTYMQPMYTFPVQSDVVRVVAAFCGNVDRDPSFLPNFVRRVQGAHAAARTASLITRWFPRRSAGQAPRRKRVLFVVGSYSIGKERLFVEIARHLGSRIFASPAKRRMLECLGDRALAGMLDAVMGAQVHVVEMGRISMRGMGEYLQTVQRHAPFASVVAFSPTGWTHGGPHHAPRSPEPRGPEPLDPELLLHADTARAAQLLAQAACMHGDSAFSAECLRPRGSSSTVTIFPVPYSEHSSFAELARFVCSLKATRIVPTVFASPAANDAAARWLQHWQDASARYERCVGGEHPAGLFPTLGLSPALRLTE